MDHAYAWSQAELVDGPCPESDSCHNDHFRLFTQKRVYVY